jgi:hypothetical protein
VLVLGVVDWLELSVSEVEGLVDAVLLEDVGLVEAVLDCD